MADKPVIREDKGKDFVEFVLERLESDYSRNRIGRNRYENGKSGMNIFQIFLRTTNKGTYKPDNIYVGEISVELIDKYIKWRRWRQLRLRPSLGRPKAGQRVRSVSEKVLDVCDRDDDKKIIGFMIKETYQY